MPCSELGLILGLHCLQSPFYEILGKNWLWSWFWTRSVPANSELGVKKTFTSQIMLNEVSINLYNNKLMISFSYFFFSKK